MENELEIRLADADDINTIGYLAQQIWPAAYKDILSPSQLEYMLNLIYSPEALKQQMNQQHQFLIAVLGEEPVGFASYSSAGDEGVYKLHKLYVAPQLHGKGLGKALLDFIIEEIISLGATTLRLNMNRDNKAKNFYQRSGFIIIKEEDIDIGNNYFMNDYVMEKKLKV
ncbi:MAG: GNAT family N-acetyltransferase [Chitinophagaceae bacterium]|nr:GNAT family N-acetyltransferase [Chitinophagaceae bacterium]